MAQTSASALSGSKLDNRRMLAALIDLAIVGAGGAAILVAAGVLGGDGTPLSAPLAGVVVGWGLYYWFACETGGGQTLGKKLTRVRVVRVDGSSAGMREIGIRTVLRVIDTVLVGLIAMLATGERRARLGDLAAGTKVVSADGAAAGVASAAAAAAVAAPSVAAPAEGFATEPAVEESVPAADFSAEPAVEESVPDEDFSAEPAVDEPVPAEDLSTASAFDEPAPVESFSADPAPAAPAEPASAEVELAPADEAGEGPVSAYEPITGEVASDEAPSSYQPITREQPADEPAPDIATPTLKELAEDVAAAAGSAPDAEPEPERRPRPVAEVEIGGPEIDVDSPEVTVRSVETVSAIDLVMGSDEPPEDRPTAAPPPAGA